MSEQSAQVWRHYMQGHWSGFRHDVNTTIYFARIRVNTETKTYADSNQEVLDEVYSQGYCMGRFDHALMVKDVAEFDKFGRLFCGNN